MLVRPKAENSEVLNKGITLHTSKIQGVLKC